MRAAAMAASHPACPAPTTTTSNCSVNGGMASLHSSKDYVMEDGRPSSRAGTPSSTSSLELRAADIGERNFLPLRRGKIPIAGAGFVIISARAIRDSRRAPVVHADLQQGAGRNPDPGTNGTAFQFAQRQCGARRWAPEMSYAVGTLSHAQHHRVVCQIKGQRHEIVRVRAEPRLGA